MFVVNKHLQFFFLRLLSVKTGKKWEQLVLCQNVATIPANIAYCRQQHNPDSGASLRRGCAPATTVSIRQYSNFLCNLNAPRQLSVSPCSSLFPGGTSTILPWCGFSTYQRRALVVTEGKRRMRDIRRY